MRVVGYIPHPEFKISVFSLSEKYIVKIEAGYFEQSYKFPAGAVEKWQDLETLFDESFMQTIRERFLQMAKDSLAAHKRLKQKTENKNAP